MYTQLSNLARSSPVENPASKAERFNYLLLEKRQIAVHDPKAVTEGQKKLLH